MEFKMEDEAATNRSVWNFQHGLLSSIRKIKALKLMPVKDKESFHSDHDMRWLDARCCYAFNVGSIGIIVTGLGGCGMSC